MAMLGPPIRERAEAALTAHAQLLRAIEQEPARQRDDADPAATYAWAAWYDDQLTPAWEDRDRAVSALLEHPQYAAANHGVWGDSVTETARVPFVWRPVARAIVAAVER